MLALQAYSIILAQYSPAFWSSLRSSLWGESEVDAFDAFAGNPYADEHGAFGDNVFRYSLLSMAACEAPLQLHIGGFRWASVISRNPASQIHLLDSLTHSSNPAEH